MTVILYYYKDGVGKFGELYFANIEDDDIENLIEFLKDSLKPKFIVVYDNYSDCLYSQYCFMY